MFRFDLRFEHATAPWIRSVLSRAGWTDLIEVRIDDEVVYTDTLGVANDLEPAFDILADRLEGRSRFEVAAAKVEGTWEMVAILQAGPFGWSWSVSAVDRSAEPAEAEAPQQFERRSRTWKSQGYLHHAHARLRAEAEGFAGVAERRGIRLAEAAGPWLELRGEAPRDPFGVWHERFAGRGRSADFDALWLALVDATQPCVRVDHHGLLLDLEQYRRASVPVRRTG